MFISYFSTALRRFLRHKQSTLINIIGLSTGLGCVLIIALYAIDEFRYDGFHENASKIYRFNSQYGQHSEAVPLGPYLLNEHLYEKIPEIRSSIRIRPENPDEFWLRYDDIIFDQEKFLLADSNFFSFFSFPLVKGHKDMVLTEPNSLVISEKAAMVLFGDNDPVGETIYIYGEYPATVTGIMVDFPHHSHFKATMVANIEIARNYADFLFNSWGNFSCYYYFLLEETADAYEVAAKINQVTAETVPDIADIVHFDLQRLLDIRLHSANIAWDIDKQGNITLLSGLVSVAIVILLLASVNYINLCTVQSTRRRKETGIRKLLGASRMKIFLQSMTESFISVILSIIVAIGLAEVFLPYVYQISGKELSFSVFLQWPYWLFALLFLISLGFLSGFYPALIAGRFKPADIFRSSDLAGTKESLWGRMFNLRLRQIFIAFQFFCSMSLIILSLSINRQIQYMLEVDYGYEPSNLFVLYNPDGENQESRFYRIKNKLEQYPEIEIVTAGVNVPSERLHHFTHIRMPEDEFEQLSGSINIHHDYFSALGSKTLAGRTFSPEYRGDDLTGVIINRTAAHALGYSPEEIINKEMVLQSTAENLTITGVIEDINYYSLHELVTPMIFTLGVQPPPYSKILVRSKNDMTGDAIQVARRVWQEDFSEYPFNLKVIEDRSREHYTSEFQTRNLMTVFMTLAIIISLMGLFALSSYVMTSRIREIAIRKVMGATPVKIFKMIGREFSFLVLFSALIAWPVAWILINRWLENFAYRQDINYAFFILALITALLAAWITISFHGYKAASTNPANALKYE